MIFLLKTYEEHKSQNTLRLCYEAEIFTKSNFLWNIAKLLFVRFAVNKCFRTDESFFKCFDFLVASFVSVYKIKCFMVNICK